MERLFLVDQTLDTPVGSDFEYLRCLAEAAACDERMSIVLGASNRFRLNQSARSEAERGLFESVRFLPSFRSSGNLNLSWLAGMPGSGQLASESGQGIKSDRPRLAGLLRKYKARAFRLKRRKQIARFACDCNRFFRSAMTGEFRPGDQVFFSNLSELELMGLAVFLANAPSSSLATWHLQFRHDLPTRELGFGARASLTRKVRACFMASLSRVPDHDLQFYGISSEQIERYNSLALASFSILPYPVSSDFAPIPSPPRATTTAFRREQAPKSVSVSHGTPEHCPRTRTDRNDGPSGLCSIAEPVIRPEPVRMVVPVEVGAAGELPLQRMVADVWEDYFAEGKLQVAFSSRREKKRWSPSLRPSIVSGHKPRGLPAEQGEPAIEKLQGPLSQRRYRELIRNSDFALLLPGARHSDDARSLGELLSCGKPVLVPAGSFAATKLQPAQDRHVDSLRKRLPRSRSLQLSDLRFGSANAPLGGGVVSFDRTWHPFCAEAEKGATENLAVVRFRWQHSEHSHFVRIRCIEERLGGPQESAERVAPKRRAGCYSQLLFRLGLRSDRIRLEFENAFGDSSVAIRDLSVELFSVPDLSEIRLGSNGLIYADPMSIRNEITEVVENVGHYQRNAKNAAQAWWRSHDPRQMLAGIAGARYYETLHDAA